MNYLTQVLARRFHAQQQMGHQTEALGTASKLISLLDSVEEKIDKDNAAELAVIYETQEKEQLISNQRVTLSRQRWIATAVALMLLSIFFLFYALYRRRYGRRRRGFRGGRPFGAAAVRGACHRAGRVHP